MHGDDDQDRQPNPATSSTDLAEADTLEADPSDLWAASLEAWVCGLNIQRFRGLLAEAADPHQRAILTRLIDEHEASFHRFASAGKSDGQSVDGGA